MTSDKFKKYSSIENHYQEGFIMRCPEGNYTYCILEKIHGSNFQIYYDGENFLLGSRNRFINKDESFYGLQNLAEKYEDEIRSFYFWSFLYGVPLKELVLYGEIYGDGIQKGVKYCKNHKIRFFDIKINGEYVPYKTAIDIFETMELPYIPVKEFYYGRLYNAVKDADTRFNSTIAEGEYAELENNLCEGVVIKPYEVELKSQKGDRVIIKKKNEEFFEKKQQPKIKPDRFVDYTKDTEKLTPYLNENRFNAVFSKDVYERKNFGDFIKAYATDVILDAAKDGVNFSNIKTINNVIARTTKEEYFRRVA